MINYSVANELDCERLDFLFSKLLSDDKKNYDCNIKDNLTMSGFFFKRINLDDTILFVARYNNNIIGYIYGYVRSDNAIKMELESYIDSLYVEEEYRCQKVGTTLLNLFIEESEKRNVKYIFIDNKYANVHAKAVYEKLGFNQFIEGRRKELF